MGHQFKLKELKKNTKNEMDLAITTPAVKNICIYIPVIQPHNVVAAVAQRQSSL